MYTQVQKYTDPHTLALRQEIGRWLKEQREATGRSQRDVAELVGVEFYTWVSQLETGRGRVPPDRYEAYANALNMNVRDLVMKLFPYYDPVTARVLFSGGEEVEACKAPPAKQQQASRQNSENAAMWHREALQSQNALREFELKANDEVRRERDRAEAAEAKLRKLDFLLKETAFIATRPNGGSVGLRSFFLGFLSLSSEQQPNNELAKLGRSVNEIFRGGADKPYAVVDGSGRSTKRNLRLASAADRAI